MEEGRSVARELLTVAMSTEASLTSLVSALQAFHDMGGTSTDAVSALESIRNDVAADEQVEDIILEALDIASGWCREDARIWTE